MKHTINLFQQDLIPEQPWLNFTRVLLGIIIVCAVLVAWKATVMLQVQGLQSQINVQRSALANEQQQLAQISEQLRAQQPSSELKAEVNRLETEVLMRQFLLAEFQRRGQIKQQDYAELLTDLAILHREGVWLTRIHQDRNRLNLHGHSVNASILPQWMQSFKTSTVLSERRFNMVELKRDSRDLLSFVLQGNAGDMADFSLNSMPARDSENSNNGSDSSSQQRDIAEEVRAAQEENAIEREREQEKLEEALRKLESVSGGNR